jgi:hypothetical protein
MDGPVNASAIDGEPGVRDAGLLPVQFAAPIGAVEFSFVVDARARFVWQRSTHHQAAGSVRVTSAQHEATVPALSRRRALCGSPREAAMPTSLRDAAPLWWQRS